MNAFHILAVPITKRGIFQRLCLKVTKSSLALEVLSCILFSEDQFKDFIGSVVQGTSARITERFVNRRIVDEFSRRCDRC